MEEWRGQEEDGAQRQRSGYLSRCREDGSIEGGGLGGWVGGGEKVCSVNMARMKVH